MWYTCYKNYNINNNNNNCEQEPKGPRRIAFDHVKIMMNALLRSAYLYNWLLVPFCSIGWHIYFCIVTNKLGSIGHTPNNCYLPCDGHESVCNMHMSCRAKSTWWYSAHISIFICTMYLTMVWCNKTNRTLSAHCASEDHLSAAPELWWCSTKRKKRRIHKTDEETKITNAWKKIITFNWSIHILNVHAEL